MTPSARPRVLVAEDDAPLQHLMTEVLRGELGAEVVAVADGEAAVAALAEGGYALAVLDLRMPGEDGFAVLRRLASRPADAHPPVVVCTAAGEAHQEAALRLGAAACIAKPFDVDDLIATVRPFPADRTPEPAS
jgi:CheY-like chemotaxis protein